MTMVQLLSTIRIIDLMGEFSSLDLRAVRFAASSAFKI